jgi:hypothetical protein
MKAEEVINPCQNSYNLAKHSGPQGIVWRRLWFLTVILIWCQKWPLAKTNPFIDCNFPTGPIHIERFELIHSNDLDLDAYWVHLITLSNKTTFRMTHWHFLQVLESAFSQRGSILDIEQLSRPGYSGRGHVAALVALAELRKISSALQQVWAT